MAWFGLLLSKIKARLVFPQSVHNALMWFSPSNLININKIYHTALCCDSLSIPTYYSVSVIITLYCFHSNNTYNGRNTINNQFLFQTISNVDSHKAFCKINTTKSTISQIALCVCALCSLFQAWNTWLRAICCLLYHPMKLFVWCVVLNSHSAPYPAEGGWEGLVGTCSHGDHQLHNNSGYLL